MLSDEDIDKLCHGRIIYAPVYRSDEKDAAGPHWAVILDPDDQIQEFDTYNVAVISHDDTIDQFLMPVPPRTGLTGYIQGSWTPEVALPGIQKVGAKLEVPEMIQVLRLVRRAREARRSTQS